MGPLQKEQLKLHFDFGRHANAGDASSVRSCIRRLRPSLLVIESAFIDESERKGAVLEINNKMDSARASRKAKSLLLDELFGHHGLFEWPDFGKAVMKAAISEPGLRLHLVESSPGNESMGDMFVLSFMMNAPMQALRALYEGDAGKALSEAERGFRAFNDFVVVRRNAQAVEGFRRLTVEIPELHPSVQGPGPVHVLTRFGLAHAGMAQLLRLDGFDVGDVVMPAMDCSTALAVRYSTDSGMAFSIEERRRILYDYALGMTDDGTGISQDEDALQSRELLASIGGGKGFMSSALRLARASPSFEDFQARLGKFFENAQKGIYSTAAV